MRMGKQWLVAGAAALLLLPVVVRAQSTVTPEDEYKKLVKVDETIDPLGPTPFGERVNLYDGSLTFEVTDISLRGHGPQLEVIRSLHTKPGGGSVPGDGIDGGFSDWDIELPRVVTITPNRLSYNQWRVLSASTYKRCTYFSEPPSVPPQQGGATWEAHTWWSGYQLIVPGATNTPLLKRSTANTLTPQMGSTTFPIVTKQNWMITCGVLTDDETNGGEGFLAIAPDGTKYTLNHLIYRWAPTLERPIGSGPTVVGNSSGKDDPTNQEDAGNSLGGGVVTPQNNPNDFLLRREASMLVTRVEDRFGNTLTYTYDPNNPARLTAITASDGRQVTFTYDGTSQRIATAVVTPSSGPARTWSYQYDTSAYHLLTKAVLPDGSAWTFNMGPISMADMTPTFPGTCTQPMQFSPTSWTGSMTTPSGLTGSFTIAPAIRGRSYVPKQCVLIYIGSTVLDYASIPQVYALPAIVSKTFSGAGVLPTQTWTYSHSAANASWSSDPCAAGGTCPSTVWSDVVDPEGHAVRSTFSNRFDASEGLLLRTDAYSGAVGSTLLRSETYSYADPAGQSNPNIGPWNKPWPWPTSYGGDQQERSNHEQTQQNMPLYQRTTTQAGDTYTWQAEKINAYLAVTQTKRFNSISGQLPIQEIHYFYNDATKWILSQPYQLINVATGELEWANTFDPATANVLTRSRFGQQLMAYTWKTNGNLASFTDGNNHTTILDNYHRGVPRSIQYPDGTSQTLTVDDFGQVKSITDQAGSTTSYTYDPVGRLTGITYPSGDEQAWLPQTFSYSFVTSAERGLAANHWRRTASVGNASTVTTFDALLRPVLSDRKIGSGTVASTLTTYDSRGQTVFSAYPSATALNFSIAPTAAGVRSTYDALGRITQSTQSSELGTLTTATAYLSGARRQVTDPKGHVFTTSYQVFDQPAYDAPILVQTPGSIAQAITRDIYGKPLSVTQSGPYGSTQVSLTKTWLYDIYQRLCRTWEPESNSTVIAYDGANNIRFRASGLTISGNVCGREQVAAAVQTTYTFDAMNRTLTVQPPAGTQSTVYTYDAVGNRKTAQSGPTTWSANYNKRGMPTSESLTVSGAGGGWTLGYVHDAYGHLATLQYPNGENVGYAPDALGRPTQVGSYATGIGYFANDAVSQLAFGNGAAYVAEQNTRQLPSNFSYGKGSTLDVSEDLTYDADGNLTQVTDLVDGTRSKALGYDALDRLTSASAPNLWGSASYTYDPLNNIRTRVVGGQTATYSYDASNRLSSVTGLGSYTYDARGNTTSRNGQALVFDSLDQLSQIVGGDSYAYDAAGRRVVKTPSAGTPTYSFYSQAGQLMYQKTGTTATNFIYLGTKLIARKAGSATTYVYADNQGTPLKETDTSGNTLAAFDYMPYGSQALGLPQDGPGYTGHVHDVSSGLVYMQARYYDPVVGRFLSRDPVDPSPNDLFTFGRYGYANNNPYKFTDPDGRATVYHHGNRIVIVQTFKNNGTQFSDDQIIAQGARLSGQTSDGKVVIVKFESGNIKDTVQINSNSKLDDTSSDGASRSHADRIGGRTIEIAPNALGEGTVGHEMGHILGAGDQYKGGLAADGKTTLSEDVAGGATLMKTATGAANTQTIDEIYKGSSSESNTQIICKAPNKDGGC